ncbi:UDP-N-acetylglucosamine 1-carboxyvinyltransferase [Candidatus Woesebacteria bacterium]|nr:UDP-N-acetylglucosamine 1-carboxyvinyltransferase [Candidatus Woesebacteria bacterium]
MEAFKVTGGTPLNGSVRIGGAKNASYKLMIAALLGNSESRILNFSHISDVDKVTEIISYLGGIVHQVGERALVIDPRPLKNYVLNPADGAQGRFSPMFIPALLAKFGHAEVPNPGGDKIGKRPLDRHFEGLAALGARVWQEGDVIRAETDGLTGATYRFSKNTHTGTETLLMAAVLAKGKTILENAAEEPEVDDLIAFLNAMGAKIRRRLNKVIEIEGVSQLGGAIHKIMPDRNEAVSYACAALVTKGDVIIENAVPEHLTAFLEKLEDMQAGYEVGSYGIRFYYKGPLLATDVTTTIAPGFMTDWQPLFATVLTQAQGVSTLHETIMQNRFQYVDSLVAMGAQIEKYNPTVTHPEIVYNFNMEDDKPDYFHALKITGATQLKATECTVHDLRHGATLILAALCAQGSSLIRGIEQVERGYESLAERLSSMGAQIERVQLP